MINSLSRYLPLLAALGAMLPFPAAAQECNVAYETMIQLRKPEYGSYNVWDTVQGELGASEKYVSGALLDKNMLYAAGERLYNDKPEMMLVLSQINRRGRVLAESEHAVEGLTEVIKITGLQDGLLVAANIKNAEKQTAIWLGFFEKDGTLKSSRVIDDPAANLSATDLFVEEDGKTVVLAAAVEKPKGGQPLSVRFYKLNEKGERLSARSYVTGSDSLIYDIFPYDNGYIGVGYSRGDDGRKNGWIMRLNRDFGTAWQHYYPRGAGAVLYAGAGFIQDNIVVGGVASPAQSNGLRAGWVMVVSAYNGNIGWQRYFTEDVHYDVRGINVEKGGVINALLNGARADGKDPMVAPKEGEAEGRADHVRLLTMDPRGALIAAETFYNGDAANAVSLIQGNNGERILLGSTVAARQVEKFDGEAPAPVVDTATGEIDPAAALAAIINPDAGRFDTVRSREGWVLAASPLDPYIDPCVRTYTPIP